MSKLTRWGIHTRALDRRIAALDKKIAPLRVKQVPFVNSLETQQKADAALKPLEAKRAELAAEAKRLSRIPFEVYTQPGWKP